MAEKDWYRGVTVVEFSVDKVVFFFKVLFLKETICEQRWSGSCSFIKSSFLRYPPPQKKKKKKKKLTYTHSICVSNNKRWKMDMLYIKMFVME